MPLDCPLEEARRVADRGIQESHLVELVQSNRQMGHLAFFHMENQIQSKYRQQLRGVILLKHLCYPNTQRTFHAKQFKKQKIVTFVPEKNKLTFAVFPWLRFLFGFQVPNMLRQLECSGFF